MSEGVNKVILLGNISTDPELRFTQGGQGVLSFNIATNESYLDRDKQRQERVDFHSIVVWGKRGEALAKFLKKGFGLLIEGSLRRRTWDDNDGRKCYKTEVIASNVIVTKGDQQGSSGQHRETRADGNGQSPRQGYGALRTQQRTQGATTPQPANGPPLDDFGYDGGDDIPF